MAEINIEDVPPSEIGWHPEDIPDLLSAEERKIRRRDFDLRRRFGITYLDYANMVKNQKGCCAICLKKRKLFVDHNHTSGKVRELLCNRCNLNLGILECNLKLMKRMLLYLKKHQEI